MPLVAADLSDPVQKRLPELTREAIEWRANADESAAGEQSSQPLLGVNV